MIWFVRLTVVGGSTLLGYQRYPDLLGIFSGFMIGLVLLGLSIKIGELCQKISARAPSVSVDVGVGVYWMSFVFAILSLIAALWDYALLSDERRAVTALLL